MADGDAPPRSVPERGLQTVGTSTFIHKNDPAHIAAIVRETIQNSSSVRHVACSARIFRLRNSGPGIPIWSRRTATRSSRSAKKRRPRRAARHGGKNLPAQLVAA